MFVFPVRCVFPSRALQFLQQRLAEAQQVRDGEFAKLRAQLQKKAEPLVRRRAEALVGPKAKKT